MGMVIRRSLTLLNSSRTLRAVRRRETVRRSDDNSRRKVQNVRGHSSLNHGSDGFGQTSLRRDWQFATDSYWDIPL
jgi:hypothetical protein